MTEEQHDKPQRGERAAAAKPRDPFLRAAGEDDDGYDPYSDRPYVEPLYEPDPWA